MGAPDYFAVMVLAFIAVTTVLGSSKIRGFASLGIGLLIGTIGIDPTVAASSDSPSASRSSPTASTSSSWRSACSPSARPSGSPPTCAAVAAEIVHVDGARMTP